ncbi:Cyclic nucleotide-binding domain-containing protein [Pseudobacteriovorax antillogorgiicola]|uniref:Cyclic nucleotide-binding domain-containing protein n=2 Tax=Pseudobacteriovorax antillogorgiicola TaxID=1513793 RepID=A0A1Y6CFQ9_9BACT|nr:cyclic nucleotide-binding protein [Pseudobacteriovorax antillogorgiicola]SMF50077.1 Cyclic nucleotide-binding domain-containing protein [Pseudobacteriovorax antillogorgiicola]
MSVSIDVLRGYRLFSELSESELKSLSDKFRMKTVPDKEVFIHANEISHNIYLIVEGGVSVEVATPDQSMEELAKLHKGQTVGEFILAKETRRSATVRAIGELTLYETSKDELTDLFENHPRLGYLVYRNLSEVLVDRIRDTNMLARNALGLISQQF